MLAISPYVPSAASLNRFAGLPASAAPTPAPAPPACSTSDQVRIQALRNQAAACRHNGVVVGVAVGAIGGMVALGGSVIGGVMCGMIGAIGVAANFSRAGQLEREAALLEARCQQPTATP